MAAAAVLAEVEFTADFDSGGRMEQAVTTSPGADRIDQLRARAAQLREHSLRATSEAGSGHPTSCLSAADIVAALFFDVHALRSA